MKRTNQDYAGRRGVEKVRTAVAGARRAEMRAEVASFLNTRSQQVVLDSSVISEFSEFLAGGEPDDGLPPLRAVDPVFKERLRSRLWRLHLLSQPAGWSGETH